MHDVLQSLNPDAHYIDQYNPQLTMKGLTRILGTLHAESPLSPIVDAEIALQRLQAMSRIIGELVAPAEKAEQVGGELL
jgi:hypothetical protein